VGAFWTPDQGSISTAHSENPGTWNRYAFVAGDPVNFRDPRGRDLMLMSPPGAQDCTDNPDQDGCNDPCQPNPGLDMLEAPPDPSCIAGPVASGAAAAAGAAPSDPGCYDWGCMPAALAKHLPIYKSRDAVA